MTIDVEKMLRETVPGGSVCDPQTIADSIRAWFAANGAPQIPTARLTDRQIAAQDARYAIDGAITYGRLGENKPPVGHWLAEYWSIGRQLARLGETSAWDNQTPVSAAPPVLTEEQRSKVRDAIAEALGGAYDCLQVWSAWGVGSMGPDDFHPVAEDDDRVAEIADAAIGAMIASQPTEARDAEQKQLIALLREARSTLEMWKDVAPAVSLCSDIDAALAAQRDSAKGK
ncbi:hypothetical protein BKK79_00845 [Cupriavidus sp. USMAA2-4]|uniref:hypothetical protein n=1 Tax=Cupriavidus sp. USMAA2-4 TaxID=876364 RepID=UPI0008A6B321|nr:hypothetical protein [Cupriavidus sp. USMAA2-4]AOY90535.1 hypothetical protein BKK79_00845 [Cupriavidus sp. USMAA2-4]